MVQVYIGCVVWVQKVEKLLAHKPDPSLGVLGSSNREADCE